MSRRVNTITSRLLPRQEPRGHFLGKVDGADAQVELIVGSGGALACIVNGSGRAEWSGGRLQERRLCLVSRGGIRLDGEVKRRVVRGTVLLPGDGEARTFSAAPMRRADQPIAA
jgi:hypothetical protein